MTFLEARLSLQFLAEERIGGPMRTHAREAREAEDAAAAAMTSEVSRGNS